MAIGNVVRPAGRQDRGEPTLGGTSSGNRPQDWQAEIDHGGKEALGGKRDGSEPGTAGPRDLRLPWWLPDPAEGGVAVELQEAITQLILPAYQQLVLEAPSVVERVAGEMLIQALWADCLRQLNRPVIGSAMRAKRRPAVYSPPVPINRRLPARGGAEPLLWRSGGSTVVPKRPLYFAPVSANYSIVHCGTTLRRTLPGKPAVAPRWKLPSPLHTMHCVMVMAATWTDVSTGHRKGAEIRGTTACGQTGARKVMRHCIPYIALRSWRPPGRILRRTMARGGDPQREGLWPDGAREKVMRHCIPCIALAARRSRSGSLCAGDAAGSASRWCRLSLRERTELSRSERRLISPRRFPTTPLNLPVWSARRPRFWARRSRPGISWSRSRRCA